MPSYDPEALDSLIDEALSSEPMRAAPATLHRRVEERVRIAALRDKEKARFRYSMASLAFAFVTALGLAAMLITFTNLESFLTNGVSGGKGQYDRFAVYMSRSWSGISGVYLLVTSMALAAGTLLLGLIPLRRITRALK